MHYDGVRVRTLYPLLYRCARAVCQKTSRNAPRVLHGYYALDADSLATGYIPALMDCKYNNKVVVVVGVCRASEHGLPDVRAGDVFTARG